MPNSRSLLEDMEEEKINSDVEGADDDAAGEDNDDDSDAPNNDDISPNDDDAAPDDAANNSSNEEVDNESTRDDADGIGPANALPSHRGRSATPPRTSMSAAEKVNFSSPAIAVLAKMSRNTNNPWVERVDGDIIYFKIPEVVKKTIPLSDILPFLDCRFGKNGKIIACDWSPVEEHPDGHLARRNYLHNFILSRTDDEVPIHLRGRYNYGKNKSLKPNKTSHRGANPQHPFGPFVELRCIEKNPSVGTYSCPGEAKIGLLLTDVEAITEEAIAAALNPNNDSNPKINLVLIHSRQCVHHKRAESGLLRGNVRENMIEEAKDPKNTSSVLARNSLDRAGSHIAMSGNTALAATKASTTKNVKKESQKEALRSIGLTNDTLMNVITVKIRTEKQDLQWREAAEDTDLETLGIVRKFELVDGFEIHLYTRDSQVVPIELSKGKNLVYHIDCSGDFLCHLDKDKKVLHLFWVVSARESVLETEINNSREASRFVSTFPLAERVGEINTGEAILAFMKKVTAEQRRYNRVHYGIDDYPRPNVLLLDCEKALASASLAAFVGKSMAFYFVRFSFCFANYTFFPYPVTFPF